MPIVNDLSGISLGAMAPSLTPLGPDAKPVLDASLVSVLVVVLVSPGISTCGPGGAHHYDVPTRRVYVESCDAVHFRYEFEDVDGG